MSDIVSVHAATCSIDGQACETHPKSKSHYCPHGAHNPGGAGPCPFRVEV